VATFITQPSGKIRVQIRRAALGRHEAVFNTREEAEAWAAETEPRLMIHALKEPAAGSGITFSRASELYLASPAYSEKAASTQKRERECSVHVIGRLGPKSVSSISRATLQDYFDARNSDKTPRGGPYSGHALRLERAYISSVFRYCLKRNLANSNPANTELDLRRCNKREIRISDEQHLALLNESVRYALGHHKSNPNLIPWVQFVFATGTRPGEAAKIQLTWLNLERREIRIPRLGSKNRRPRVLLLNERTTSILQFQVEKAKSAGSPYLFWSRTKKCGITPYAYNHPWRAICRRCDVPDTVVPHGVRHEFISRLFEAGGFSAEKIAKLVGDVHVLSLEPYTHLETNVLREELETHLRTVVDSIHDAIDLQPDL